MVIILLILEFKTIYYKYNGTRFLLDILVLSLFDVSNMYVY